MRYCEGRLIYIVMYNSGIYFVFIMYHSIIFILNIGTFLSSWCEKTLNSVIFLFEYSLSVPINDITVHVLLYARYGILVWNIMMADDTV